MHIYIGTHIKRQVGTCVFLEKYKNTMPVLIQHKKDTVAPCTTHVLIALGSLLKSHMIFHRFFKQHTDSNSNTTSAKILPKCKSEVLVNQADEGTETK